MKRPKGWFAGATCGAALAALFVMIVVIAVGNLWFLNFIHVLSSLLWTGIDLYMGFVLGPILRRLDLPVRRGIVMQLTPRTLFLMPAVSIIAGTTGWFLAVQLGYTALEWPAYGWVAAALTLVTLMTILGLGFLTPVNVWVCLELQKREPDLKRIGYLDAVVFLRGRGARRDADRDHRRHDAVSRRHLSGVTIRPAPPPDVPARPRGPPAPIAGWRARPPTVALPQRPSCSGGRPERIATRMSSSTSRRPGMLSPRGMRDLPHAVAAVDGDAVGRGAHVAFGASDDGDAEMRLVRRQIAARPRHRRRSRCGPAFRPWPSPATRRAAPCAICFGAPRSLMPKCHSSESKWS